MLNPDFIKVTTVYDDGHEEGFRLIPLKKHYETNNDKALVYKLAEYNKTHPEKPIVFSQAGPGLKMS